MYGIWKSEHEMRNCPQDAWDVIESDEWIGNPFVYGDGIEATPINVDDE